MASSREVQNALSRFREQVARANKEVEDVIELIQQLEEALEGYDEDADLEITRGIRSEIKKGKREIDDLRKSVDRLDRELSDTKRIYHHLSR